MQSSLFNDAPAGEIDLGESRYLILRHDIIAAGKAATQFEIMRQTLAFKKSVISS